MFVYFGRNYAAAQTGSVVRHVECEKCDCVYAYELVRRGTGRGTSPYMLDNAGAQRRADRRAAADLRGQLQAGVDPVACPDCGWYQAAMVGEVRRRRLRPLVKIAVVTGVLGAIAAAVVAITWLNRSRPWDVEGWLWSGGIVGGLLGVAGGSLGVRAAVLRGENPNRDYPVLPSPYPGAPLAIKLTGSAPTGPVAAGVETRGGAGGVPTLGYQRQRPEILPGGWVTMQLLGSTFPEVCCRCGVETTNRFAVNFDNVASVPVRLCRPCARREWWRVFLCGAAGFVAGWALAATIAWTVRGADTTGRLIGSLMIGPIVGAFGGYGAALVARRGFGGPVRLRRFVSELNTIELRFRRVGYADLFVEAAKRHATVRASGLSAWPAALPKRLKEPLRNDE